MAEVDLGRVQGFSAYEVAKQNGYVGTEAQWLESLHGPKGDDGGPGKDGADGASAGFGTPTASVDANVGTPSVTIEASGSNAAKVFNFVFKNLKGEKGDKGERGPAGSVVIDDALSSTSANPVQNKVVKAEFDQVNSNLTALNNSKLKGYTVEYNVPANSGGWHKIAQVTGGYFNFDLYTTGNWSNQRKSNAHFHIQNINGTVRIVQLSGLADSGGITAIRMVRVVDDRNTWILEEHSSPSTNGEFFKFTIAGDVTVTPLDGSVDTTTDFKDSVSLTVSDIPTGAVITTGNLDNALSGIGKCKNLLKPTLQTTTQNGVTCTANGDGTYTLNGTASRLTTFILRDMKLDSSLSYKLTGCPLGGDWDNGYSMYVEKQYWGIDVGEGYEIILTDASNLCGIYIRIIKDTVCNNLVFKPMLTTNLDVTYDDFVPYTGDGDTLTADVAELKNDLSDLKDGTTVVAKATEADSAIKASQDGEGNNIATTYAKKTEIPGGGSTAENVTVVAVSGVSQSVVNNSKCKNDRVVLGFYITVAAGTYNTIRIADITSDHGPTEVVYGTAICTTKYSGFDEYTKPYPFQINKAKSIYLKINETFTTNMTFYISLAYDI